MCSWLVRPDNSQAHLFFYKTWPTDGNIGRAGLLSTSLYSIPYRLLQILQNILTKHPYETSWSFPPWVTLLEFPQSLFKSTKINTVIFTSPRWPACLSHAICPSHAKPPSGRNSRRTRRKKRTISRLPPRWLPVRHLFCWPYTGCQKAQERQHHWWMCSTVDWWGQTTSVFSVFSLPVHAVNWYAYEQLLALNWLSSMPTKHGERAPAMKLPIQPR